MKILFAAGQAAPYVRAGGLAEAITSLSRALALRGHDVRVVVPLYPSTEDQLREEFEDLGSFQVDMPLGQRDAKVYSHKLNGVIFYLIDNPDYFWKPTLIQQEGDDHAFSYFSHAVLGLMDFLDFYPQVLHLNDWHVGPVAALLRDKQESHPQFRDMKLVYTIHNLGRQGIFSEDALEDYLGLDSSFYNPDGLKHKEQINFMKAGIVYSDHITTVSRSYAREIVFPYLGEGLNSVLLARRKKLTGVVNGIDYDKYNPATDSSLWVNYNSAFPERRLGNKKEFQETFGLEVDEDIPLLAMVSRLENSKGLDLLTFVFDELMEERVQFVLMGSGDKELEENLLRLKEDYPDRMVLKIGYDEDMARKIFGSADVVVMPSRYEPCGLSQLIAMRYGALPVVRNTGGLADTVEAYNRYNGQGTGFVFDDYCAHGLLYSLRDAIYHYGNKDVWWRIVKQAMEKDLSWREPALVYEEIYNKDQETEEARELRFA